jgi:hypothetical protein
LPDAVTEPDPVDLAVLDTVLLVLSAQVSYRKSLLTSPNRTVPAMESEIRSLFSEKELGIPVHHRDIPTDERKFILRNLEGYTEKFDPDGNFTKAKARVFVNGSKQLSEYTAKSSSPVAIIESIAAFKGWHVVRFDVVCGYPNAVRPPEVQYKYLRA